MIFRQRGKEEGIGEYEGGKEVGEGGGREAREGGSRVLPPAPGGGEQQEGEPVIQSLILLYN